MNIPKAIETIKSIKHVCRGLLPHDEQDALSLGIEALKREIYNRENQPNLIFGLLPDETEGG